jgi:hypothetical protein
MILASALHHETSYHIDFISRKTSESEGLRSSDSLVSAKRATCLARRDGEGPGRGKGTPPQCVVPFLSLALESSHVGHRPQDGGRGLSVDGLLGSLIVEGEQKASAHFLETALQSAHLAIPEAAGIEVLQLLKK